MGTRRVVADALRLTRLVRKDPGLALVRADLGPMAAAILAEHLGGEVRRRPVAELHELVDEDLAALRDAGVAASRAGRAYCDQWRRAGVLVRATAPGSRRETYELSAPAEAAIRFLVRSGRPRPVATQSRLETISTRVSRLARDSDPTAMGRLEALRAERDALDAEIARVEAGDFIPLDGPEAAERLAEILALAEQVPGDFTRIRNEIAALNRSLREHVVSLDATRGDVLDDIFRGVDRIESSETGRSFLGFHEQLMDSESSARLDENLETVLARAFATRLEDAELRFLRRWRSAVAQESTSVRSTMDDLSRSLKHFVRSRAFEDQRRLGAELAEAQRLAARLAARTPPQTQMDLGLALTGVHMASIGAWRMRNPADAVVTEKIHSREVARLDLEEVRRVVRASEIDLVELIDAVDAVLEERGAATVAEVLAEHPATQGLASVVGLLLLARRRGQEVPGDETVTWRTAGGAERSARIPRFLFTNRTEKSGDA